ncbi:MAG: bifunctional UDP-N-acetylmuramoyl-tripeptide:D-alanyl-D-alanine ligase/alanine racemase [Bacteroidales bacterium]|nr:bifunctional UDP-N-acetylmuramoyl-tripeptide:D-alanyl-D-alanine ligase/alanine racemase [Bacteroidales bacterium]
MSGYLISDISNIISGRLFLKKDTRIEEIYTDSRKMFSSDKGLFFTIPGKNHDGHNYIEEMLHRGILNFVVSKIPDVLNTHQEANVILVPDVIQALQKLAAHHRGKMGFPVIGITGSNGKTIVKEWLYQCLSSEYRVTRNPKSYNSQIGVPLSVWLLNEKDNLGIFEAGISLPGEMEKLEKIIKPNIGIFTNIGQAHQENFKNLEEKILEKIQLFRKSDVLIYCKDHTLIDNNVQSFFKNTKTLLFNWSQKEHANVIISGIIKKKKSTEISVSTNSINTTIVLPFTDSASIENSIHVITLLLYLKIPVEKICRQISQLLPVAMRLEQKKGLFNCTLINDSYNSDFNSLTIALDFVKQQSQHKKQTLILSDILQSGRDEKSLYQDVSSLIKSYKIQRFVGVGPAICRQKKSFPGDSLFFENTDLFLADLSQIKFNNETILIKGARIFEFEKITARLEEKLHRSVLEINLNALVFNLNYFRSLLKPRTKIMVMVKALGYGSGSYEIANELQHQRVDYLAVAYTDEGIELRNAGIHLPVMVMNPDENTFDALIAYKLEPEIFSLRTLKKFIEALDHHQEMKYPVHLKIDTGMHRQGFLDHEIPELISVIKDNKVLSIISIFSHLAASDDPKHDDFTLRQIGIFEHICNTICAACAIQPMRHIMNSAGIERFPEYHFEMVRLGIGLHGLSAAHAKNLMPVSSFKSTISQIKEIPARETIGYNRRGKYDKKTTIGIVPVGYADGLNRKFGNETGYFIVNGEKAKIVGDVCMDMCMVNLTGIQAGEGDEVVFFGKENPVQEVSKLIDTIPYEILTNISSRVKRVYFKE